ncbi:tetraacyldisaccharide 4'-kinase [Limisalsivibrio acetivorans]|uniref:tetraacyldisaccharide 4'-kinase n=1 Tax=Limisalsivibrio acetivorans TaxID=1304888 RepID=UPI0003B358BF|nr:tetraacyldisaccharide 4'-kinase [Limisalsivibrio acetivorans]
MRAKVISVGNISLGGTGKTPFTIMLTRHFLEQNKKVCILSRGYRGKAGLDTTVISDGSEIKLSPPEAADEPYMMAKACPGAVVITGKERLKSAQVAEERFDPDIIILDDGFQHKRMPRDVDILLMDQKRPVSTGLIFPFGYLREFPRGIQRADIVVFTRAIDENIEKNIRHLVKDKPIFFSKIRFKGIYQNGKEVDLQEFGRKKIFAFAGIASPMKFFRFMKDQNLNIGRTRPFRDHADYTDKVLNSIEEAAERINAEMILTTEKDYVKLPDERKHKYAYAAIDVELNDLNGFLNALNI